MRRNWFSILIFFSHVFFSTSFPKSKHSISNFFCLLAIFFSVSLPNKSCYHTHHNQRCRRRQPLLYHTFSMVLCPTSDPIPSESSATAFIKSEQIHKIEVCISFLCRISFLVIFFYICKIDSLWAVSHFKLILLLSFLLSCHLFSVCCSIHGLGK